MRVLLLLVLLALGAPPAPSLSATWTGVRTVRVVWSGPGILVVANGGQPYLVDYSTDATLRAVPLGPGGDGRAVPYPGMRLEVRDAEGRTLAEAVVPAAAWRVWMPWVGG